jgi:hypothetical protein
MDRRRKSCGETRPGQSAEVRTAVAVAIDTGRRPEDILGLPLDCLGRDWDGAPVLVIRKHRAVSLGVAGIRPHPAGYQART